MVAAAEKLPPFDVEAEEAVIASILVDEDAISRVEGVVAPEDFFRDQNRWAYEACVALWERGETINQVTLAHELSRAGRLDDVGGIPWIARITTDLATPVGVEHYARIVKRDATYRSLIGIGSQIVQLAYQGGPDLEGVIGRAENLVMSVRDAQRTGDLVPLRDLLDEYWERPGIDAVNVSSIGAIRSGFMDLDTLLGGFQRSDLVVVAARPGVGKSALLLNFARNAAFAQNARVAVFTIEMAADQLVHRLLAAESGIDVGRIRLGQRTELEERKLMTATGELHGLEIYIDDSSVVTIAQLQAKLRRLAQQLGGLDLVIIDYLQLMHGSGRFRDNRVQEVSEISRGLKMLARDLDVPIIAAAQLSRAAEMRQTHVPLLSDLRESGSIEQDADVVMFLYREDMYVNRDEWEEREPDAIYPAGLTKLIVAKHRNGPTGQVALHFRSHVSRFEDLMVLEEDTA
ncbi:MAG TPA: replicative DNA helicase [Dehalococcoidia bacterium]|nr:replicative DNA helicase [Dehalococcoidia bacterium]